MKKLITTLGCCLLMATASFSQWTTVCGTGNGMVVNMVPVGSDIYATGFFTNICGENAKHIARYDGASWHAMDTGLTDAGHRISDIGGTLYISPYMQSADSNWVLKWDGSHFSRVGEGVYLSTVSPMSSRVPNIYDVVSYRGRLVACGEFDIVGGRPIKGIMQWNGTQWDSVGSGLSGEVVLTGVIYPHQMLVIDTSLYVVGNFKYAGGVTVNGIARWDGYNWHAMGAGFNNFVYALAMVNGELYAGGEFTMSGSTVLQRIARWNGTDWVHPGFGVYYSTVAMHAYVHTIGAGGTRGIFEGGFDRVIIGSDTINARSIIAFGGGTVSTLDGGITNGELEGLITYDDTALLVGGATFSAGAASRVSRYRFHDLSVNGTAVGDIKVYPQPFTNTLIIETTTTTHTAHLLDMMGRETGRYTLAKGVSELALGHLPPAMYVLELTDANGNITYKKVLKQ
ncbi:hypothetical protein GCM10023093_23270 [Nemorincola caseinilytica]|uniref:T9SS C-terminal target domain-containing protein n=1 Tax=Nemorincola caseinilytica TaxID=2054315 RepID=A0ABP8NKH0_9BACT